MGERALVETGIRALGEPEQVTFGVLAGGEGSMHVDVVAGLASPGEHLASHHVAVKDRTDAESGGADSRCRGSILGVTPHGWANSGNRCSQSVRHRSGSTNCGHTRLRTSTLRWRASSSAVPASRMNGPVAQLDVILIVYQVASRAPWVSSGGGRTSLWSGPAS